VTVVDAPLAPAAAEVGRTNMALAMVYGIAGVANLTLQPLVYGPLVTSGRISEPAMGWLAGTETTALAVAAILLPGWLSRGHFGRRQIAMAALAILANLASLVDCGWWALLAARLVCGFAEGGILAGFSTAMIGARHPERMNGLFLAVSCSFAAVLAYFLPTVIVRHYGPEGGFLVLSCLAAMAMVAAGLQRYRPPAIAMPITGWRRWPITAHLALLGIVAQNAAVMAGWTFLESTAINHAIDSQMLGISASIGVLAQVAGAASAAAVAHRLAERPVLVAGGLVLAASIAWLGFPANGMAFLYANVLMGFIWLALVPLSVKLVIAVEPARQAVYLAAPAQTIGSGIGPLLAANVVTRGNVGPAYVVGAILAALAVLLFGLARGEAPTIKGRGQ
jgi:predicted MFS family arabinose efflux permease